MFPNDGITSVDVKIESIKRVVHVEEMLQKEQFINIGEIGLDLYWDKSTIDIQKEAFRQIELLKTQITNTIHVRDSFSK